MPKRKTVLANGETYHVFNKSIYRKDVFTHKRLCSRALETLWFYRIRDLSFKFSRYKSLKTDHLIHTNNTLIDAPKRVIVYTYKLMPNHFHLLLRQESDGGISRYLADFQNSYTRYFNKLHSLNGPIFMPQFKAVRIETDEQLSHVHRYIHINALTAYLVKSFTDLENYPWSSYQEYLGKRRVYQISDPRKILENFKSLDSYKTFLSDQVDYQRELHQISHLLLEDL